MKKHITNEHENHAAQFLIEAHTIGDMRSLADFHNVKYNIRQTLAFTKDIITNFEGTNEEKGLFIDKVLEELEKFKING